MSEDNKALVRRVYDEVFGQGDLDLTEELFSQDFELHDGLGSDVTGPAAVKQVATMLRSAFPDFQTHVEDLLTDGNKVAGRWNWTGTHKGEIMGIAPTDKQVTTRVLDILRIENGKIQEVWVISDLFGLMHQLGAISS